MANETFVGWVSPPNVRGTSDIIWSSLQTIILCAWVSICVNLPRPNSGISEILRDKFHFFLLTFLGPELVFLIAYSQLRSARASVARFKEDGYDDWTIRHGFYADMGGIHVVPPDWKQFPVNAKQLHYLVKKGYMEYPKIACCEIDGRSKTDGLGRFITIFQTFYFTVTTFARFGQGLAVSTLELTVLGFVLCTVGTSLCWWNKPNDVEIGHTFKLNKDFTEIIKEAGSEANGTYRDTPLDFVCDDRWAGSVLWLYYVGILRQIKFHKSRHGERPIQRISSLRFTKPPSRNSQLLVLWLGLAYIATFFAAWNFEFPTEIERILWRFFATLQCVIYVLTGLFEVVYFDWESNLTAATRGTLPTDVESAGPAKTRINRLRRLWTKPYNNHVSKHPWYNVPLRSLIITTPLCAAYCVCRWYLLTEDIIGLRSLPASAYQTVDWTRYLPSFSR